MSQWWSWALTAVGVFGLWLAGRKDRRGWLVGLGAQLLWLGYALATSQYGFIVSALTYGAVYVHNARAWKPQSDIVTCQPTTKEHPVQITIGPRSTPPTRSPGC